MSVFDKDKCPNDFNESNDPQSPIIPRERSIHLKEETTLEMTSTYAQRLNLRNVLLVNLLIYQFWRYIGFSSSKSGSMLLWCLSICVGMSKLVVLEF